MPGYNCCDWCRIGSQKVDKIWFIRAHSFTVRDFAPRILIALTLFYVGGYLLEWMR